MKPFWAPQTRSTRAIWMLEETGIDYDMERVDIRAADRKVCIESGYSVPMQIAAWRVPPIRKRLKSERVEQRMKPTKTVLVA